MQHRKTETPLPLPKPCPRQKVWNFQIIGEVTGFQTRYHLRCEHMSGDIVRWNLNRRWLKQKPPYGVVCFRNPETNESKTWSSFRAWLTPRFGSEKDAKAFMLTLPLQPGPKPEKSAKSRKKAARKRKSRPDRKRSSSLKSTCKRERYAFAEALKAEGQL